MPITFNICQIVSVSSELHQGGFRDLKAEDSSSGKSSRAGVFAEQSCCCRRAVTRAVSVEQ